MLGIWVPSLPSVGHATGAGTRPSWMPLLEYSGDAVKTTGAAERGSIRRARRRQANRRPAALPGPAPAVPRPGASARAGPTGALSRRLRHIRLHLRQLAATDDDGDSLTPGRVRAGTQQVALEPAHFSALRSRPRPPTHRAAPAPHRRPCLPPTSG